VEDDREQLGLGDRVLLIVEDDTRFAKVLLAAARERGFKGIVADRGDTGLALAHEFKPDGILLDLELPIMHGASVLDHLKHHPATRHIPVHVISGANGRTDLLRAGAAAYFEKPVSKETLDQALAELQGFIERGVKGLLIV